MGSCRIDESSHRAARAHRTANNIELGVGLGYYFFTTLYSQGIRAAFRDQIKMPKSVFQLFQEIRFVLQSVIASGYKMELHAVFVGQFQGGIVLPGICQFVPTDHPNGIEALFVTYTGHRRNMVGKGSTKGEQCSLPQFLGFEQVVFQLAVLVARDQRVNGIFPFDMERYALFS